MGVATLKLFLLLYIDVVTQGNGTYTHAIGESKEEPFGTGWNYIYRHTHSSPISIS